MTQDEPRPRLVTTSEAAEILGVPAGAIATWKARRKVMPVRIARGRGRGGQPVYWLHELQPLAEKYLNSTRRRPRDTP